MDDILAEPRTADENNNVANPINCEAKEGLEAVEDQGQHGNTLDLKKRVRALMED